MGRTCTDVWDYSDAKEYEKQRQKVGRIGLMGRD